MFLDTRREGWRRQRDKIGPTTMRMISLRSKHRFSSEFLTVPWSPHQTSETRPYLGSVVCPLCFPPKFRLTRVAVGIVRTRWNFWCNCGHPLKTAHMTGPCTSGAAQEVTAKGKAEGMFLLWNKLAQAKGKPYGLLQHQGVAWSALQ